MNLVQTLLYIYPTWRFRHSWPLTINIYSSCFKFIAELFISFQNIWPRESAEREFLRVTGAARVSSTTLPFIPFRQVKMWVAAHWIFSRTGSFCNPSNDRLWNIQTSSLWGRSRNTAGASKADWVRVFPPLHSPSRPTLIDTPHAFQACNYGAGS